MGGLEMMGAHFVLALETSTSLLFHPYLLFSLVLQPWEARALGLEKDRVARVLLRSMPQFLPTLQLPLLLVCRLPHRLQPWPGP